MKQLKENQTCLSLQLIVVGERTKGTEVPALCFHVEPRIVTE